MARMWWNILKGIPMFSLAFRYIELSVKNVVFCVSELWLFQPKIALIGIQKYQFSIKLFMGCLILSIEYETYEKANWFGKL